MRVIKDYCDSCGREIIGHTGGRIALLNGIGTLIGEYEVCHTCLVDEKTRLSIALVKVRKGHKGE